MARRMVRLTFALLAAVPAASQARPPVLTAALCDGLPLVPALRLPAAGLPSQREARPGAVGGVRRIVGAETTDKATRVKQIIAERQRPVAFLLRDAPKGQVVGDLWVAATDAPAAAGDAPAGDSCGDTMVAVAYDDARYSGAFEVLRDCGQVSYEESVVWVRYEDFDRLCACAVELVEGGAPAAPASAASD